MTDAEPCEGCGTPVHTAPEVNGLGQALGPPLFWERTGTINGHLSFGKHTRGRCSAIASGKPAHPFVGEASDA